MRTPPYLRCEYDIPTVAAIQAMAEGAASSRQQKEVLQWVINQAAATYDQAFQVEGDRETNFALGRAFVGQQIVKLMKVSIPALQKAREKERLANGR